MRIRKLALQTRRGVAPRVRLQAYPLVTGQGTATLTPLTTGLMTGHQAPLHLAHKMSVLHISALKMSAFKMNDPRVSVLTTRPNNPETSQGGKRPAKTGVGTAVITARRIRETAAARVAARVATIIIMDSRTVLQTTGVVDTTARTSDLTSAAVILIIIDPTIAAARLAMAVGRTAHRPLPVPMDRAPVPKIMIAQPVTTTTVPVVITVTEMEIGTMTAAAALHGLSCRRLILSVT
jgi:hypothetical protein